MITLPRTKHSQSHKVTKLPPPTSGARHSPPAPRSLPRLPTPTHAARAHPACRHGPSTHTLAGNRVFCIWQPCAPDSGNKIATSAHGMGSGGLAVDAMAIGCLGVDRRCKRFFVLSLFSELADSKCVFSTLYFVVFISR
jgi:hypothetical protein